MRKLGKKTCDSMIDRMFSKADDSFEIWEDLIERVEIETLLGLNEEPPPLCGVQVANYSRREELPMIGRIGIWSLDYMAGRVPYKDSVSAADASARIKACGGEVKQAYKDEFDYGGTAVEYEAKTLNAVKCLVDRLLEKA